MNIEEARQIIHQYREALARVTAAVGLNPLLPEESLPHPRATIKEAIRFTFGQAGEYDAKQALLDSYVKLANFVPSDDANRVAAWISAAVTGDKELESAHRDAAVSILSKSLASNDQLRRELVDEA